MEDLKITQEVKYLESIGKWCAAIYCADKGYSVWTGGCFNKDRKKAIAEAMDSFKKSVAFQREVRKSSEKEELVVTA